MGTTLAVVFGVVAAALAGVAAWLWRGQGRLAAEAGAARREAEEAGAQLAAAREAQGVAVADIERFRGMVDGLRAEIGELKVAEARFAEREESLGRERAQLEKRVAELREQMGETFKALAADALQASRQEFLQQARPVFDAAKKEQSELVRPISETLSATREKLEQIERQRLESFSRLGEQLELTATASKALRGDYNELIRALSQPTVRGRYGELQLKRVAELAGMTAYCDFDEQSHTVAADGRALRPDMIVRLPNERVVAVDAKCNTYAYVEAAGATDPVEQERHLERFANHVADQVVKLSRKGYWAEFDGSPDFVVMFVPGDQFLDAALARKPDLLERAAERDVILASPSTLIGLLRAVAVGWREHALTEKAQELFELGKELHERAATAFEHASKLGDSIRQSVERYNKFVGSIDTRVLPTLRRFEEAGVKSGKELPEAAEVTVLPRGMQALPGGEGGRGLEGE